MSDDNTKEIPFPIHGLHKGFAAGNQPGLTSSDLLNVRLYDVVDGRGRGGQRPAWVKWGNGTQIGGTDQPVVAMCLVSVRVE